MTEKDCDRLLITGNYGNTKPVNFRVCLSLGIVMRAYLLTNMVKKEPAENALKNTVQWDNLGTGTSNKCQFCPYQPTVKSLILMKSRFNQ